MHSREVIFTENYIGSKHFIDPIDIEDAQDQCKVDENVIKDELRKVYNKLLKILLPKEI